MWLGFLGRDIRLGLLDLFFLLYLWLLRLIGLALYFLLLFDDLLSFIFILLIFTFPFDLYLLIHFYIFRLSHRLHNFFLLPNFHFLLPSFYFLLILELDRNIDHRIHSILQKSLKGLILLCFVIDHHSIDLDILIFLVFNNLLNFLFLFDDVVKKLILPIIIHIVIFLSIVDLDNRQAISRKNEGEFITVVAICINFTD